MEGAVLSERRGEPAGESRGLEGHFTQCSQSLQVCSHSVPGPPFSVHPKASPVLVTFLPTRQSALPLVWEFRGRGVSASGPGSSLSVGSPRGQSSQVPGAAPGMGRRPCRWAGQQKPHLAPWVSVSQRKGRSLFYFSPPFWSLWLTTGCWRGPGGHESGACLLAGLMPWAPGHGTEGHGRGGQGGGPEERTSRQDECALCDIHVRSAAGGDVFGVHPPSSGVGGGPAPAHWQRWGREGNALAADSSCADRRWRR